MTDAINMLYDSSPAIWGLRPSNSCYPYAKVSYPLLFSGSKVWALRAQLGLARHAQLHAVLLDNLNVP